MDNAVELTDIIGQLRREIARAMRAGEDSDLRFDAETVTLELTVGVERSAEPGVKVRFWVLDVGANARHTSMATQRITLTLRPVSTSNPGRSPRISGAAFPGEY